MAEQQDQDQKTEEPTSKKLDETRDEGQVILSSEVRTWFMLLGGFIVFSTMAPAFGRRLTEALVVYFNYADQLRVGDGGLRKALADTFAHIAPTLGLIALIFIAFALAGTMSQTGFFASMKLLEPKWERLSPITGFRRIFSKQALMELLKGLIKITLVGAILYGIMKPLTQEAELFVGMQAGLQLEVVLHYGLRMLGAAVLMVTIFAFLDYLYQRHLFMQKVRMTKQEVKDEMKQTEGDPIIRHRLRQIRMERSRRRMMASVPTADVVLTNPTHYAVALKYEQGKRAAPRVVAKGQDRLAQKIREVAEENDVPIVENPPLTRALHKACDIDDEIPVEQYKAVAEVISYVYRLKKKGVSKPV